MADARGMSPTAVEVVDNYTIFLDYDGDGNLIYAGKAKLGSTASEAVWQIIQLSYSSGNLSSKKWANGDLLFDKVWNNRVSESYS